MPTLWVKEISAPKCNTYIELLLNHEVTSLFLTSHLLLLCQLIFASARRQKQGADRNMILRHRSCVSPAIIAEATKYCQHCARSSAFHAQGPGAYWPGDPTKVANENRGRPNIDPQIVESPYKSDPIRYPFYIQASEGTP